MTRKTQKPLFSGTGAFCFYAVQPRVYGTAPGPVPVLYFLFIT